MGSRAIQIFSRGWPSHVDHVLGDGTLLGARSDSVGGKPPGVQIRPANYEVWTKTQSIRLNATAAQETAWLNFLTAQIGKPYDFEAIAAFAIDRDWRNPEKWFCSELAAAALEACKWFPKPLASVANEITPRDLLLVISSWAT